MVGFHIHLFSSTLLVLLADSVLFWPIIWCTQLTPPFVYILALPLPHLSWLPVSKCKHVAPTFKQVCSSIPQCWELTYPFCATFAWCGSPSWAAASTNLILTAWMPPTSLQLNLLLSAPSLLTHEGSLAPESSLCLLISTTNHSLMPTKAQRSSRYKGDIHYSNAFRETTEGRFISPSGGKGNPSWLLPSGETGVIHTYQQTIQNTDGGNGRCCCCCGLSYSILDISNCISRQSVFPSRGLWHFKYYCHVLGPIIYIQLSNLYVQLSNIDNSGVFAYPMDAI